MKVDMAPEAITRRLEAVEQLSRAAVELGRIGEANGLRRPLTPQEREIVDRCAASGSWRSRRRVADDTDHADPRGPA